MERSVPRHAYIGTLGQNFNLIGCVGGGFSCNVYSAYDSNENRYCALKVPKDGEERSFNECLENEVRILPDCSESKYICEYYSHGIETLILNDGT